MPEAPDVVRGNREPTHDRHAPPGVERPTKPTRTLSCHFLEEAPSKAFGESTAPDDATARIVRCVAGDASDRHLQST
jgi:hypothetical protein